MMIIIIITSTVLYCEESHKKINHNWVKKLKKKQKSMFNDEKENDAKNFKI